MHAMIVYFTVVEIKVAHGNIYLYFCGENFLNFMASLMDGFQLPQVCRVTVMWHSIFYHQVPRKSRYWFDQLQKIKRLSQTWSQALAFNLGTQYPGC